MSAISIESKLLILIERTKILEERIEILEFLLKKMFGILPSGMATLESEEILIKPQ